MDVRAYGVSELSAAEMEDIAGGRSIWYYVGVAVGTVAGAVMEAAEWLGTPEPHAVW